MAMITEKTFRTESQWTKVTRNNKDRSFTFARGYKGAFVADDTQTYPFRYVSNWKEAEAHALRGMAPIKKPGSLRASIN